MAGMSWQYIAGFFDGEGCLWGNHCDSVGIYQGGDIGREVLAEIQMFLFRYAATSNIRIKRRSDKDKSNIHRNKVMYELTIGNRESMRIFLSNILPYLRVKRILVQDYLRYNKMYPGLVYTESYLRPEYREQYFSEGSGDGYLRTQKCKLIDGDS